MALWISRRYHLSLRHRSRSKLYSRAVDIAIAIVEESKEGRKEGDGRCARGEKIRRGSEREEEERERRKIMSRVSSLWADSHPVVKEHLWRQGEAEEGVQASVLLYRSHADSASQRPCAPQKPLLPASSVHGMEEGRGVQRRSASLSW